MISQKTRYFITIFAVMVLLTGTANAIVAGPAGAPAPTGSLLQRVDTFPTCAEVRHCWRNDYGKLRCGLVTRCQVCKWVKRCTRAQGCRFVETCKWGPYKPPLQSN